MHRKNFKKFQKLMNVFRMTTKGNNMTLLEVKDQELQVEVLLVGQDFPELDPLVDGILNPT